jgi:hypothetical protein
VGRNLLLMYRSRAFSTKEANRTALARSLAPYNSASRIASVSAFTLPFDNFLNSRTYAGSLAMSHPPGARIKDSEPRTGSLCQPDIDAYIPVMPPRKPATPDATPQIDRFKALARELGCGEDEAAFEAALKKVAERAPLPKHEPKKRKAKAPGA